MRKILIFSLFVFFGASLHGGTIIFIEGPMGTGKSTVGQALCDLYESAGRRARFVKRDDLIDRELAPMRIREWYNDIRSHIKNQKKLSLSNDQLSRLDDFVRTAEASLKEGGVIPERLLERYVSFCNVLNNPEFNFFCGLGNPNRFPLRDSLIKHGEYLERDGEFFQTLREHSGSHKELADNCYEEFSKYVPRRLRELVRGHEDEYLVFEWSANTEEYGSNSARHYRRILRLAVKHGIPMKLIGLTCSDDERVRRVKERGYGDPQSARDRYLENRFVRSKSGQLVEKEYDFECDTTNESPADIARRIGDYVQSFPGPGLAALNNYCNQYGDIIDDSEDEAGWLDDVYGEPIFGHSLAAPGPGLE